VLFHAVVGQYPDRTPVTFYITSVEDTESDGKCNVCVTELYLQQHTITRRNLREETAAMS